MQKSSSNTQTGSYIPKGTAPKMTPKEVMGNQGKPANLPAARSAKPAGKSKMFPNC